MIAKKIWVGRFLLSVIMAFGLAVSGCSGTTGGDGADGADGMDGQDGMDGMDGEDGEGAVPGPGDVVDMSDPAGQALIYAIGEPLVVEITGVTVSSPPVIAYKVTTQNGAIVSGVGTAEGRDQGSVRGMFDKLIGTNGSIRSHWVSYINSSNLPPLHATREEGTVVEDAATPGTYTFTYMTDVTAVTTPVAVTWEPTLTHRASMEIRFSDSSLNPDNPSWDFVPNGGALPETKLIANTNLCNNCHQRLEAHGNGRFTVENCVTCHNSSTGGDDVPEVGDVEGALTNVDLAHLAHGIHSTSIDMFDEVTYPRFIVDCAACHTASEETPDGDDWKESVDSLSCGGCHMSRLVITAVDQTTGLGTYGFIHDINGNDQAVPDGDCLSCHNGGIAAAGFTEDWHQNLSSPAAAKFQYNILSVTDTDEGEFPTITFSVTDPTNGDAKYDLSTVCDDTADPPVTLCPWDPDWGGATRLAVTVVWSTDAYSNINSGSEQTNINETCIPPWSPTNDTCSPGNRPGSPAQEVSIDPLSDLPGADNGDQTYTVTSPVAVPAGLTGDSIAVTIEGHPLVDLDGDGELDEEPPWRNEEIPVTGAADFFEIGADPTDDPTPRYQVVDINKCNSCHGKLSLHGQNRTDNIDLCVTCHNGNATDIRARQEAIEGTFFNDPPGEGDKTEESIDFKRMIHQIHAANVVIFGFGGSVHDYTEVTFPQGSDNNLANCTICHLEGTYYPTRDDEDFRLATTYISDNFDDFDTPEDAVDNPTTGRTADRATTLADAEDDINISPNTSACGACHTSDFAVSHMLDEGGSFSVQQDNDGDFSFPDGERTRVETCTNCHAPGKDGDVARAHGL